jgi:hypothetical protein
VLVDSNLADIQIPGMDLSRVDGGFDLTIVDEVEIVAGGWPQYVYALEAIRATKPGGMIKQVLRSSEGKLAIFDVYLKDTSGDDEIRSTKYTAQLIAFGKVTKEAKVLVFRDMQVADMILGGYTRRRIENRLPEISGQQLDESISRLEKLGLTQKPAESAALSGPDR